MLEIAAPQMSELCMIPGKKSSAKGFEQKGLVDLGLLGWNVIEHAAALLAELKGS